MENVPLIFLLLETETRYSLSHYRLAVVCRAFQITFLFFTENFHARHKTLQLEI